MSRDEFVLGFCLLVLAGYLMFGRAEAADITIGPDVVMWNDDTPITWESDIVIGKGSKKVDCTPGSIKFDDNEMWVCKLFPRYVKVKTEKPGEMTKAEALIRAFDNARLWQYIGIACLLLMLVETFYIATLHFRLLACMTL